MVQQNAELAEWTVMAYLAGDNNLNEEMVLTLQEIEASAEGTVENRSDGNPDPKSTRKRRKTLWPRVRIFAQLDPSGLGLPTLRYLFNTRKTVGKHPQRRFYLKDYEVNPPKKYASENTGNPAALSGFVKWCLRSTPKKPVTDWHLLILSGHGSGSTEDFLLKDENPVDSLSVPELRQALKTAAGSLRRASNNRDKKIDVLGMDCCFMSMVEVYYEIREFVDFMVGAESMVPDFGWPYHKILAKAEQLRWTEEHGPVRPEELAEVIVREFIEHYSDYDRTAGRAVDLAAVRLGTMEKLADSITRLASVLVKALGDDGLADQIHLAHLEAQTYKFEQFVDLRDLCLRLKGRFGSTDSHRKTNDRLAAGVCSACDDVLAELEPCVLLSGCSGFTYQHSYGLSIYFPWAVEETPRAYKKLSFNADMKKKTNNATTWAEFLDSYLKKTRREKREKMHLAKNLDMSRWKHVDRAVDALVGSLSPKSNPPLVRFAKGHLRHLAHVSPVESAGLEPGGSRYHKSRYHKSRYHKSRWPGDREKSVKNFTSVVGTAYWPDDKA